MLCDGTPDHCVSCGQRITIDSEAGQMFSNHKCSPRHESAKLGAQRRDYELPMGRTYSQRLYDAHIIRGMVEI